MPGRLRLFCERAPTCRALAKKLCQEKIFSSKTISKIFQPSNFLVLWLDRIATKNLFAEHSRNIGFCVFIGQIEKVPVLYLCSAYFPNLPVKLKLNKEIIRREGIQGLGWPGALWRASWRRNCSGQRNSFDFEIVSRRERFPVGRFDASRRNLA